MVNQTADALDLHHHFVARLHVGQPFRRAGGDHVARLQRHEFTQVGDQERNVENHVGGAAALAQLAVDVSAERQPVRIGDVVAIDDVRPDRRQGVAALHPQIRPVVVLQVIANGVVVAQAVARHILHGVLAADVARGLADHRHQLGFVMHILHAGRAHRHLAVAGQGVRRLEEHQRFFRRLEFQLAGVVGIVQPQGEHRALRRRQPFHFALLQHLAVRQRDAQLLVHLHVEDLAMMANTGMFHDAAPAWVTRLVSVGRPAARTVTSSPV